MSRATVKVSLPMRKSGGISAHCYTLPYGGDIARVYRMWVPDVSDIEIEVLSLQRGEASNGENMLHRPVLLVYLNSVLDWFDWMAPWRISDIVVGIDREATLMIEVEQEVPIDWSARHADEAYHSWLEKNPAAMSNEWLLYLSDRFERGQVTCAYSNCENPLVPGTRRCKKHQGE